jgi:myo-inositol-1(or 4)-monophosphatase
MAAGALMITEAGGLVGNFTGEADFLHQREVVAGNPKVYAQLVALLRPYTQVTAPPAAASAPTGASVATPESALAATLGEPPAAEPAPHAPAARKRGPVRVRKATAPADPGDALL